MGIYFSKYKYNNITNKIKDENVIKGLVVICTDM